jgi:hypothetical protein
VDKRLPRGSCGCRPLARWELLVDWPRMDRIPTAPASKLTAAPAILMASQQGTRIALLVSKSALETFPLA